ncbi:gfat-1 [Pristionchus pacificus]|uniref:glutamine--fructose-6-phosphate transaminase (isomerizing) n=1 Tax=Pristionchus pacificus TaxID=54126 RepID=A0A2A6CML9_PRIPA|nr:gfat-1 [Pristionchus pacificus]|eukprot:PDM79271.1 gfat-1 [Pristionchus pacificus]
MCGIFAYLNFLTPKTRKEIADILIQGLERMEYRGYDSAGIAIDAGEEPNKPHDSVFLFRKTGKVATLAQCLEKDSAHLDMTASYAIHCGIAHTRWATHGSPKDLNSHPQRSNETSDFLVVHNGIITNYREIKEYLLKKGHRFESETDTEVIAKLIQHIHDRYPDFSFRQLVEIVIQQLEGAFALAFKSRKFPGQLVATRRGSPLLVGIKTNNGRLTFDQFPVSFSKGHGWQWRDDSRIEKDGSLGKRSKNSSTSRRFTSTTATHLRDHDESFCGTPTVLDLSIGAAPSNGDCASPMSSIRPFGSSAWEVEYFVASDASAIVEHTKQVRGEKMSTTMMRRALDYLDLTSIDWLPTSHTRVLYLEDDDVAFVENGALSIHRIKRGLSEKDKTLPTREVQEINMELQQIMMGNFQTYMQKEIFEQTESVVNTMRGRVLPSGEVVLGGIKEFVPDIKRCRRLIMVACGTSYNSAIACRQIIEELTELPVVLELASDFLDRETPIFRDDVSIFISQSGETADTLGALRYCKQHGALVIGVTNTVGSSICRESHCGIHINAGPEIGVASTKAYTSQMLSLLMLALVLSEDRKSAEARRADIIDALNKLSGHISEILKLDSEVKEIAKEIFKEKSLLVMGRGFNFATCLEGALKIKELSYMHCEGIMSGELKHGPLAMVDEHLAIVMVICKDNVYKKSLNALQQVLARGGRPIIIADSSVPADDLAGMPHVLRVPMTVDCVQNILTVIPLQLLSYHIADLNGLNVDRPRNLAKSVTVE